RSLTAVLLEERRELHVRERAVGRDQIALVDADDLTEPVLRHVLVPHALLVVDLDDVDVLTAADADALRREALDLEPVGAPALAERLQVEALRIEPQAGARNETADAAVEPDGGEDEHDDAHVVALREKRGADRRAHEPERKARIRPLPVRPEQRRLHTTGVARRAAGVNRVGRAPLASRP